LRRSNPWRGKWRGGLLRGACHRARIRATRWLAMTWKHVCPISRHDLPELSKFVVPPKDRGRRECRVRAAPAVSCAKVRKNGGTRAYRAAENTPTSPAQWLYGLLRALPGGAGLLSPSPAGLLPPTFRQHTRRQDHTTWPYALVQSSAEQKRPSQPRPYVS
jgi:hypothetical protein